MQNQIKLKWNKLILAIVFLILGFIAYIYENNFLQQNPQTTTQNTQTSQNSSKVSGVIEATQEKVNSILNDAEVKKTLERIEKNDGYYNKDGAIFLNREKHLPIKSDREYYSEWTVKTPGEKTRGTKRIVVGKGGEMYFTDDHYNSFIKVK